MNTPLNAPQNPTDLVLRLVGGERDGQMVRVENEKFLLSSLLPKNVDADKYRCAIFRGEKGVAFRSYSDAVLCNDVKVSVQWLNQGDVIKLADQLSAEVFQLGSYQKPAAPSARQPAQTIEMSPDLVPGPVLQPTALPPAQHSSLMPKSPNAVPFTPASNPLAAENAPASPTSSMPTAPGLRAPVNTYAVDVVPTDIDYVNIPQMPSRDSIDLSDNAPKTMDSAIDSLTQRLAKLVDIAGASSDVDESAPQLSSQPTSGSSILENQNANISPTEFPKTDSTLAKSTTPVANPTSVPDIAAAPAVQSPLPQSAPVFKQAVVDTTDSSEPSHALPNEETAFSPATDAVDESAKRRSALESYFVKSGVSLPGLTSTVDADAPVLNPVSPPAVSNPENTTDTPASSTADSTFAAAPVAETASASAAKPEFDLDAVLARIGTNASTTSVSEPATSLPGTPEIQQPAPPTAPDSSDPPINSATSAPQPSSSPSALLETLTGNQPAEASADRSSEVQSTQDLLNRIEQATSSAAKPPVVFANTSDDANAIPLPSAPPTPANPTASSTASSEMKSFALLQSLGLDTDSLTEVKQDLARPQSTPELAESTEPAAAVTPQPVADKEPVPSESVADVLARMKSAGSFADFKSEENEPAAQPDASNDIGVTPPSIAPPVSAPTLSEAHSDSPIANDEDESVENYMSQLLNRMRNDKEPAPLSEAVAEKKAVPKATPAPVIEKTEPQNPASLATMTKEEFVPKQKAVRMQSLDSLREIANSTAREAFRDSVARERKITTQTKLNIAMISLAFAVLFFVLSYMTQERVNFWGVVCGIGFLIFGILTARTYLTERKLDESIISD